VGRRNTQRHDSILRAVIENVLFDFAKELIVRGRFVFDGRNAWSEHRLSAQAENQFLAAHGFGEYAMWYLGINDEEPEHTTGRHEFPHGNFESVHRCGILTAESRAGQYKHGDIENAAAQLHGMIDAKHGDRDLVRPINLVGPTCHDREACSDAGTYRHDCESLAGFFRRGTV